MANVRGSCCDGPASLCTMQRSWDIRCKAAVQCLEAAAFSDSHGCRSTPRSFVVRDAPMVMTGISQPVSLPGATFLRGHRLTLCAWRVWTKRLRTSTGWWPCHFPDSTHAVV
ncbi:ribonuclease HI [Trypanosoma cruzi]|nr:ribonuclease HI [Trypanosoma cruzi]